MDVIICRLSYPQLYSKTLEFNIELAVHAHLFYWIYINDKLIMNVCLASSMITRKLYFVVLQLYWTDRRFHGCTYNLKMLYPGPKGVGWEVVVTDYPLEYNCADITFQFIFCHYQQSLKTILSFKQKYWKTYPFPDTLRKWSCSRPYR